MKHNSFPFTVDHQRRRILRDGKPLRSWSQRHFEVLKLLMNAGGEVVAYETLIAAVWGANSDITHHGVGKTVRDLRRRLADHGQWIQNHFGHGYSLAPPRSSARMAPASSELDLDALTQYAMAQEEFRRRSTESLQRSLGHFRAVIEQYPRFASAHLGVANCLILLGHGGFPVFAAREILPHARSSIERVLELSNDAETLAAAHETRAKIQLMYEWDFEGCESNLKRALELNENHAPAHHCFAHLYLITNRWDAGLAAISQACRLAPSSPMIHGSSGWLLYFMKRYDEAIAALQRTTALHPEFGAGFVMLGHALEAAGRYEDAIRAFKTGNSLEPSPMALASLGHTYALQSRKRKVQAVLNEMAKLQDVRRVSPFFRSIIYAGLGDSSRAIMELEQAVSDGFDWVIYLGVDPRWRALDAQPRFRELLKRIGIYDHWRSSSRFTISSPKPVLSSQKRSSAPQLDDSGHQRPSRESASAAPTWGNLS